MRILLYQSDRLRAEVIHGYCTHDGKLCDKVNPYSVPMHQIRVKKYDVLVIDLDARVGTMFEQLKKLWSRFGTGIITLSDHDGLSAHDSEEREVLALRAGADYHLRWPFDRHSFDARLEALKRWKGVDSDEHRPLLGFNEIELDVRTRTCKVHGMIVRLTFTEFELLKLLMSHPEVVFSREQLMIRVRGKDFIFTDRAIDAHIKRIRQKLRVAGSHNYIKALYGSGYSWRG